MSEDFFFNQPLFTAQKEKESMISPFLHLQIKTSLNEMSIGPFFPQVWVEVKDEAVLGVFISSVSVFQQRKSK